MIDINIRNVVEEDFLKISILAENCSPMSTMPKSIYHLFTKYFKNTSFVVENRNQNEILGFLLGFISQDDPSESYIHLFCIDPILRGKGVSKTVIDTFVQTVSQMGCKEVKLITKPQNKISIKFYNKMGFISRSTNKTVEIDGENVHLNYDGPEDDKIIFTRSIMKIS